MAHSCNGRPACAMLQGGLVQTHYVTQNNTISRCLRPIREQRFRQTETAPNGEQAPVVYPGKDASASDSVLAAARLRVTARYSGAADDLRLADEMLAQARTKQLPSTRTEIGAGGELIDREKIGSHLVDTVANPDCVTAEASRDRLALASQAGSLSLALDAADTIRGQDSFGKMRGHQMTALHYGMMRATALMNKELDAAGGTAIDAAGDKRDLTAAEREAANVRACRIAGATSRMSAVFQQGMLTLQRKRTDGNQH